AAHGPPLDDTFGPATQLLGEHDLPLYQPITYRDYMNLQQSNELDKKSCLDH
ncbi:hypothetical protein HN51_026042, partial [Arachis hypogaea]